MGKNFNWSMKMAWLCVYNFCSSQSSEIKVLPMLAANYFLLLKLILCPTDSSVPCKRQELGMMKDSEVKFSRNPGKIFPVKFVFFTFLQQQQWV